MNRSGRSPFIAERTAGQADAATANSEREAKTAMAPEWFHILSIISLAVAFACAAWIMIDETRRPQSMWIMNLVWPITALFGGPWILWEYLKRGRSAPNKPTHREHGEKAKNSEVPLPEAVTKGTLHCGSGCTLGDIVAAWLMFAFPIIAIAFGWRTLFAGRMYAEWVGDFIAAYIFGIAFQYFAIAPMRGLSLGQGLIAAIKADTLSLTAWQIGMYGFMAFATFVIFRRAFGLDLEVNTFEFWFVMQLAMICGFITSFPVNWWLIQRGIKERI